MGVNLPKVSIVMAVYQPNQSWLIQQLDSLNQQDYAGEMELLVWNDSPAYTGCGELLAKYITRFPFRLLEDGDNHGSAKAFEKLTVAADGKYIAYCDQDDIWLPGKVSASVRVMEAEAGCLICHVGLSLIDGEGRLMHELAYPADLSVVNRAGYQKRRLVLRNFAFGCAMLVRRDFAQAMVPFPKGGVYHDQWLACGGAYTGRVVFCQERLLLHRIHDSNTSGVLQGINTQEDYYRKKLRRDAALVEALVAKYGQPALSGEPGESCEKDRKQGQQEAFLRQLACWIEYRKLYAGQPGLKNLLQLWGCLVDSGFSLRPDITIFEILLPLLPRKVLQAILQGLK